MKLSILYECTILNGVITEDIVTNYYAPHIRRSRGKRPTDATNYQATQYICDICAREMAGNQKLTSQQRGNIDSMCAISGIDVPSHLKEKHDINMAPLPALVSVVPSPAEVGQETTKTGPVLSCKAPTVIDGKPGLCGDPEIKYYCSKCGMDIPPSDLDWNHYVREYIDDLTHRNLPLNIAQNLAAKLLKPGILCKEHHDQKYHLGPPPKGRGKFGMRGPKEIF